MKQAFACCLLVLFAACQRQPVPQFGVAEASSSAVLGSTPPATAAVVSNISIVGNRRVQSERIKANIHTQLGAPLDEATVKADVDRLRSLNEFDDVSVTEETDSSGGRALIFNVREKPPSK